MGKNGSSAWTPYLKHPLVLVGYVIMLFTIVVKAIIKSKLATNELLSQALLYSFILGILVVVFGFILAYRKTSRKANAPKDVIVQKTEGDRSPAIITKGKNSSVNLTYGTPSKDEGAEQAEDSKKEKKK